MSKTTFEQSMKKLEQIVQKLESGDLPLEEAMQKFEEGIKLSRLCSEKLDETEKKTTLLLQDEKGNVSKKPFISKDE
ncbi:MAG: exodeoxyribonuclease VII small subunit [Deltaproteobacteria bacterium]|nr:exodeoxyribonuclease VII small subunit [Deltaproteobacteria bacterium]